jgi:hypothetical protein
MSGVSGLIRRAAGLMALAFAVAACTGKSSTGSTTPPAPSASPPTARVLVSGRASKPTDIDEPGIQVPARDGQFSVQVGNHDIVITGEDWDTIVATSKVAPDVGIEFASGFNWTATTRNRFQYLADLIARDESSHDFDPITVATTIKNNTVTSAVALYNAGNQAGTLAGLKLTVISRPAGTLVGSGEFFATAESSLLIPAKTIIFTRLVCPVIAQPKPVNGAWTVTDNFHYDSFSPA